MTASPTVAAPSAPALPADPSYKWKAMIVAGSGIFMVTLDGGIVNVALPALAREFDATLTLTQWVVLGYVLAVTGLLLPAGRLADLRGRREVFLSGFAAFGIASVLCGLAPSMGVLIAARVLQGAAGALIQANGSPLIAAVFPASERGRALGLQSSVVSIGLLSGPVVGGFITQLVGWRWAFYVNAPVALVATVVGMRLLRPSPRGKVQPFDLRGAILLVMGTGATLLGVTQGSDWGWSNPETIAAIGIGVASLVAFVVAQTRTASPLLDLVLFRTPAFAAALASGFLMFITISPVILLVPFYLSLILHLPAGEIGTRLIVIPAISAAMAPICGILADRMGVRTLAGIGATVAAVGLSMLVALPDAGSTWPLVAALAVIGIGQSLFLVPNNSSVYGAAPRERYGVVGATIALNRNLAQSFGQAIAGAIWTVVVRAAAGGGSELEAPVEALMTGFRTVFGIGVACAFVAFVVAVIVRPTSAVPAEGGAR
jgi:EmrB/QacA subfamily drug resistance transporter